MNEAFIKPGSWGEGAFADCILGECNCCCIFKKATAVVGNITFYKGNEQAFDGYSI